LAVSRAFSIAAISANSPSTLARPASNTPPHSMSSQRLRRWRRRKLGQEQATDTAVATSDDTSLSLAWLEYFGSPTLTETTAESPLPRTASAAGAATLKELAPANLLDCLRQVALDVRVEHDLARGGCALTEPMLPQHVSIVMPAVTMKAPR
jgi:hypothetical protein